MMGLFRKKRAPEETPEPDAPTGGAEEPAAAPGADAPGSPAEHAPQAS